MEQASHSTLFIIAAIGVWWAASTIATIASKGMLKGDFIHAESSKDLTAALGNLKWVELTVLQHLIGIVVAVVWAVVTRTPIWPADMQAHRTFIYIATLGHVIGNLATNAYFVLIMPASPQVVKSSEPLFTFALMFILYRSYNTPNISSTLLSVVVMVLGAATFLLGNSHFHFWPIMAAFVSNIAFPTRNIFLKKLGKVWDNPVQKFTAMSIYGAIVLLPLWLFKLVIFSVPSMGDLPKASVSSLFHSFYNLASITVLESINPVTHALLNVSKRLFILAASSLYFDIGISLRMGVGLIVVLVGAYFYIMQNISSPRWMALKGVVIAVTLVYFFSAPSPLVSKEVLNQHSSSSTTAFPDPVLAGPTVPAADAVASKCTNLNRISCVWVYNAPITNGVVSNIDALAKLNPTIPIYVYCGTTQCVNAITELSEKHRNHVFAEFAVVSNIVKDMPIEQWLARHAYNKMISGKDFEEHLQIATVLGVLWKYGGMYINPRLRVTSQLSVEECQEDISAWVSRGVAIHEESIPEVFDAAFFPSSDPFIHEVSDIFERDFPRKGIKTSLPTNGFRQKTWNFLNGKCPTCPSVNTTIKFEDMNIDQVGKAVSHFGTFSFDTRIIIAHCANRGDEVQGFPGAQFLPYIDTFIERDKLVSSSKGNSNVTLFMNAWWNAKNLEWPPPEFINPVMLSLHFGTIVTGKLENQLVDYAKKHEPIGCRDLTTLSFMQKHNIEAFFSGCLTLFITNPYPNPERGEMIYFVDVKKEYMALLPERIRSKGKFTNQDMMHGNIHNRSARVESAYQMMMDYGKAKLVITQRIHTALPCVAMGTPVIFFNSPSMPGGGGSKTTSSPRTVGLTPLFHTVDMYKMTMEEAKQMLTNFPWDNPPPNPGVSDFMRLKASAWNIIRKDPAMYDAGRKFGVIPMMPHPSVKRSTLVFHLVFTTSATTVISLENGDRVSGSFNWRHWRCIESILFHHPTSSIIIHSNTLSQSVFDVLTESGYSVTVQSYDLEYLLRDSPAKAFLSELEVASEEKSWYSFEANFLRLLTLYGEGGISIDTDVILVRPVDLLTENTLTWKDEKRTSIGSAFMRFEKRSSYVTECLKAFTNSRVDLSTILTSTWQSQEGIEVLPYHSFYMIHPSNIVTDCFESTDTNRFDAYINTTKTLAYGVDLSSQVSGHLGIVDASPLKKATLCSHLLSAFCVLCSNVH